eukprot:CAMPEP_0119570608 /NCGR_PEP_ID=MMETSP1352-20130426/43699_1 /TAXON_ID=265584 /ORGANISM="Stauroneis constricta, Strain CCMP1120" /LENGTH=427 /DNA_ID=CAMNT_0007620277 /DNA_START=164 /DNA_END=1448 /DNA_ORIENTATION=-
MRQALSSFYLLSLTVAVPWTQAFHVPQRAVGIRGVGSRHAVASRVDGGGFPKRSSPTFSFSPSKIALFSSSKMNGDGKNSIFTFSASSSSNNEGSSDDSGNSTSLASKGGNSTTSSASTTSGDKKEQQRSSLWQSIDKFGASFKGRAEKAAATAYQQTKTIRTFKYNLISSFYYFVFIIYRAYRGFFVLLPEVFRQVYDRLEAAMDEYNSSLDDDSGGNGSSNSSNEGALDMIVVNGEAVVVQRTGRKGGSNSVPANQDDQDVQVQLDFQLLLLRVHHLQSVPRILRPTAEVFRQVYDKLETAMDEYNSSLDGDDDGNGSSSSSNDGALDMIVVNGEAVVATDNQDGGATQQKARWRTRITVSILATVVTASYVLGGATRVAGKFFKTITRSEASLQGSFEAAVDEVEKNEDRIKRLSKKNATSTAE